MDTVGEEEDSDDEEEDVKVKPRKTLTEDEQRKLNYRLLSAAMDGRLEEVKDLIVRGAEINTTSSLGSTALHLASLYGHVKVVMYLLENDADPNIGNEDGRTPLHMACSPEIANVLVQHGANAEAVTKTGATPLHWVRSPEIATVLLQHGANAEAVTKDGVTPLHCARSPEIANVLLQHGANAEAVTINGNNCLHEASRRGDDAVVNFWLTKGLHIEDRNNYGETAIHLASVVPVAESLLSKGADMNVLTTDNNTVLHSVCKYGHYDVLLYFLEKGFSLKAQNKQGKTPLDMLKQHSYDRWGVQYGRERCLELLKKNNYYSDSEGGEEQANVGSFGKSVHNKEEDYMPLLIKAAEEGTVNTKWTNFSIGGASGTGKTSVLHLLLNEPPPTKHNSTKVLQPLPLCVHEQQAENNDSEDGYTSSDSNKDDSESMEVESRDKEDPMESHLIMADKECCWKKAEKEDLHRKLAECIQALGVTSLSDEGHSQSTVSIGREVTKTPNISSAAASNTTCTSPVLPHPSSSTTNVPLRIQPQACIAKSEATRKVLELLAAVKQSIQLDQTHFIHLLDTGGQASFIDIAPALFRFNSVNIFVHKLNEQLEELANFYYSVDGKRIGKEDRRMKNIDLLSSLFSARRGIRQPEVGRAFKPSIHGKPHFLIVGTFYDEYKKLEKEGKLEETIVEKNRQLLKELDADKEVRVDYKPLKRKGRSVIEPEIIFPVDATSRKKEARRIAKTIRSLSSNAYMEAEIPVRWYLIQIDLNQFKAKKQDMISITKLLDIGAALAMDEKDVKAALRYFHDLTICLYFHEVLPDVVFLSPECLFNKLSEIIAVSLGEHTSRFSGDVVDRLVLKGIFDVSLFDDLPSSFSPDLFSVEDFLELMNHLLVITPLSDSKDFFIPCVLPTLDDPMDDLLPAEVKPIILKWKDAVPSGLLPSLVMALCQSEITKITLAKSQEQFRNKLTLDCSVLEGSMILFEVSRYIGVLHTAPAEHSPVVLEAVLTSLQLVVEKFKWVEDIASPIVGFFSQISNSSELVFSHPNKKRSHLVCPDFNYQKVQIDSILHLSWFLEACASSLPTCVKTGLPGPDCYEVFTILKKKSAQWDDFARELLVPDNFRVSLKRKKEPDDTNLEEILKKWMESETRPVSWSTIEEVLTALEMKNLLRDVQQHLNS